MEVDCIDPVNDHRIRHCNAILHGRQYHYVLAEPLVAQRGTIILAHGWPDLSIGWRYQIPMLIASGYRVASLDLIGFGRSDAPKIPPASMSDYSLRSAAHIIKSLASILVCDRVILGGHDWGGVIAYRVALWYPDLVQSIFTICTPYSPPAKSFTSTEDLVTKRNMRHWAYQLQLASGEVGRRISSLEEIKSLLNGVYGGRGRHGERGFDVHEGILFANLPLLERTKLMDEGTLQMYAEEYARSGLHQTQYYYDSRAQNFEDELALDQATLEIPILFIQANKDDALPPSMSAKMEQYCPRLTRRAVNTSHWALWEAPEEVNAHIKAWLESMEGARSNL